MYIANNVLKENGNLVFSQDKSGGVTCSIAQKCDMEMGGVQEVGVFEPGTFAVFNYIKGEFCSRFAGWQTRLQLLAAFQPRY